MGGICIVGSLGVTKASLEAAFMACDIVMVDDVENCESMVLEIHSHYMGDDKLILKHKEVPHYRDLEYGRKNKRRFR